MEKADLIYYSDENMYNWLKSGIVSRDIVYREAPNLSNIFYNLTAIDKIIPIFGTIEVEPDVNLNMSNIIPINPLILIQKVI